MHGMPACPVTVTATFIPSFSDNGDGTYTIHTTAGWGQFCDMLAGGETFSGKTVNLDGSFTISRMAGDTNHKFAGTFNGCGNTLSLAFGTSGEPLQGTEDDNFAPFCYTESATIRNLNVGGTIYTATKHCGGIIGLAYGTTSLNDCHSSVNIISSINGDGTHGGLIACTWTNSTTNITGCVFDGSIQSASGYTTDQCGGFVGWRNGTIKLENCLLAADLSTIADPANTQYPSATFVRNGANDAQYYTNSYYTATLGTVQGMAMGDLILPQGVTVFAESGDSYTKGEKTWYYPGKTVTINAPEGYGLGSVSYTPEGGAPVPVTHDENGRYSFVMPAGKVTVTAAFEPFFGTPAFILPGDIRLIGESAFEGLTSMTAVEIPSGCESIGKWAFKDCTGLTKIRIPASVTSIDDTAFDGCADVLVFGAAGSAAETFCGTNASCTFIMETTST